MEPVYFTVVSNPECVSDALLHTDRNVNFVLTKKKADKEKSLPAFRLEYMWLDELFGDDSESFQFFFSAQELAVFTMLKMTDKLFADGAATVVYLNPAAETLPEPRPHSEDTVSFYMGQVPGAVAPTASLQHTQAALQSIVFYNGPSARGYVSWVLRRFLSNYQLGYSSIADTAHTGAKGDRLADFAFEWPGYAGLFGVHSETIPLPVSSALKTAAGLQEVFDDGTPIHPLLKPYYARNYRLRISCVGHPFAHRILFTDKSILAGEESGIPLTAMADCIWQSRPDLQALFPSPKTTDRIGYLRWFAANAAGEYGLDQTYISAVQAALQAQPQEPSPRKSGWLRGRHKEEIHPTQRYEKGVNLCAHIRGEYGIGEASRMAALTLQTAGEPFTVVDIASERDRDYSNTQWLPHITNTFPYDINILYTNADGVAPFLADVSVDAIKNRYNIAYWAWEMPEFPDEWLPAFEPFDEVWTLSQFSADAIATKSPVPVYNMPHPVVLDTPNPAYSRAYFSLPEQPFIFLAMYDVRSVPERKNPMGAIRAFLKAFEDRTDVQLVLKVNAPQGWVPEGELSCILQKNSNIHLMDRFLTRNELNGLLAACNAYVSLHRCEGFGFGPAEAMLYGKPAVVTGWSGNMEYAGDGACALVNYQLVELQRDYGPYRKGWHWAQPDIDDAADKMTRLVEDPVYYGQLGKRGQKLIQERFSAGFAAETLKERLTATREKL